MEDVFVKKEKILEKKYVEILEKVRQYYKDIEHQKVKEVTGKEVDDLLRDADAYMKRIKKLFEQIDKKTQTQTMRMVYRKTHISYRDVPAIEPIPRPFRIFTPCAESFVERPPLPKIAADDCVCKAEHAHARSRHNASSPHRAEFACAPRPRNISIKNDLLPDRCVGQCPYRSVDPSHLLFGEITHPVGKPCAGTRQGVRAQEYEIFCCPRLATAVVERRWIRKFFRPYLKQTDVKTLRNFQRA
ncbi:MAG: hypothetical protein G01um101448_1236, partial [Parcubacteria group bacterium Gr01-1014_48]